MTEAGATSRGRRRAWTTATVVIVAALLIALTTILAMQGSSEGATAIRHAKAATAIELARADERLAAGARILEVRWSAVPSPAGGGHLVTARITIEPSGGVSEALFAVTGARVTPQNALARSFLPDSED